MKKSAALLLCCVPLAAADLAKNVRKLIETTPAARTAFWGIQVVDLETGKTLYEHNAGHYFVPASNAKLFSTTLALTRLGAGHTFETRVAADAAPDAGGRVRGLRLIGGGDPNLNARSIPYRKGVITGNPLAAMEDLADQIVARGVRFVEGDITGDDTWYLWQPYAVGWSVDDPQSDDGPPISALTLTDNVLTLRVLPGAAEGEPAAISLLPAVEFYNIENRVRTVAAGGERRVRFKRIPGSRYAELWGTVPLHDTGVEMLIGVEDPAEYAAEALRVALQMRGVTVSGGAVALHRYPGEFASLTQGPPESVEPAMEFPLARRVSAPLIEDLRITDKVSQNLHAELALRAVGRERRGLGSFESGLAEMKDFLTEIGVAPDAYNLMDGSGLSRLDLITPETIVKLLRYMYGTPSRKAWISLLPVAAEDGTLEKRFAQTAAAGRVHAKTGSLSHVSTLSGYVQRRNGSWLAFSIMVNNYQGAAAGVRAVMDRICNLLLE